MKLKFEKLLKGTGIKVVRGSRRYYYDDCGIVIEIGGGLERFMDPSIWRFSTDILADQFITHLFKAVDMKQALTLLNREVLRFKMKNGPIAKESLHKLSNDKKFDLLKCIGWEPNNKKRILSIVKMREQCGKNYEIAIHENVACFILGIERNTKCHTCKMAKYDIETGWLKCDGVYKAIPREKIGALPQIATGEFTMLTKRAEDSVDDIYTNLCVFDVNECNKHKFRHTPKTNILEIITF